MIQKIRSLLRRFTKIFTVWTVLVLLLFTFLAIVTWKHVVFVTPVGAVSVYWYRFPALRQLTGESKVISDLKVSKDSSKSAHMENLNSVGPLGEGAHFVWPWDKFYTYETRLRKKSVVYEVVSSDGLHYEITLTFRWKVLPRNVVGLNSHIGPDYVKRLLIPDIGAVARGVVARYDAEALYTGQRQKMANQIYQYVTSTRRLNGIGAFFVDGMSDGDYISLKDILITSVKLPPSIRQAIERKLQENQRVEQYKFRVEREKLESERKAIEAQGIAKFQSIVAPQITESYLRWRGIEATLALAESKNSKIVVIGNSETGLPLILDTGSSGSGQVSIRHHGTHPGDSSHSAEAASGKTPANIPPEVAKAAAEDYARKADAVHRARAEEAEAAKYVQDQAAAAKAGASKAKVGGSSDEATEQKEEKSYHSGEPGTSSDDSDTENSGSVSREDDDKTDEGSSSASQKGSGSQG